MTKYRIKVLINGSVTVNNQKINSAKIVDEYTQEMLRLAEQKLIKVKRIEVEDIKKQKVKKYERIDELKD